LRSMHSEDPPPPPQKKAKGNKRKQVVDMESTGTNKRPRMDCPSPIPEESISPPTASTFPIPEQSTPQLLPLVPSNALVAFTPIGTSISRPLPIDTPIKIGLPGIFDIDELPSTTGFEEILQEIVLENSRSSD
ncbi:4541_t:CDS:2, partial [Acaulospora colombiana]